MHLLIIYSICFDIQMKYGDCMKWIKTDGKIVISGILMMLVMGSVYSYSVFRVPIERYYDVSSALSGIPYMLSLFFYALFMGISGKIMEKTPHFKVMVYGSLFIASGWLVAYLGKSFLVLSLGYGVLIGTGIGLIYGIPLTVITNRFPNKKGLYLGLVLLGFGLSPFITAPLMQTLVESLGIHMTFLTMSASTLVVLLALSLFYRHSRNPDIHFEMTLASLLKKKSYWMLYGLFFIGTFIGLSVIGFSSSYIYTVHGYTLEEAAFFVSLFAVFNGLGRVLYGGLSDRFSTSTTMTLSFGTLVFGTGLVLAFPESVFVFIISFSILWLNLGGWLAIAPVATSNLFGKEAYSRNYGVLFSAYGISALLGVFISGVLVDAFDSYQAVFWMFFALSVSGLILTGLFRRHITSQ